ncbi:hypothetical protein [Orbus mooreae]|uniref:hypothetical protein n=1 Tax=Orbus mooreae TaxID=3074107 RepID=UPI00370DD4DB
MEKFLEVLNKKHVSYKVKGKKIIIGGSLYLEGTAITQLPDNLSVGGSLYLDDEKIQNIAFRKNCGYSNRTIFAAWIDNTFKIKAGCFLGTIDQFENAVDKNYSGDAAESYKRSARECIEELNLKLNSKFDS